MARYAHIRTATGAVENVSEWDGTTPYTPPSGIEMRLADDNAEVGGTWDGSAFVRATIPTPSRTEVLMYEVTVTVKENGDNKTSDEIAAEKAELRTLLTNSLTGGNDLNWAETQTLLRLERE